MIDARTLATLVAVSLMPLAVAAEKPADAGKGAAKSAEMRSEHANSQHHDGATRGQERAAEVKQGHVQDEAMGEGAAHVDQKSADAKGAADEMKKKGKKDAAAEAGPAKRAPGFWSRWFGGSDD